LTRVARHGNLRRDTRYAKDTMHWTLPHCRSLLAALITVAMCASAASPAWSATMTSTRPNILWISCEDTSPWLGFCGEPYAVTPHLDRLAREGVYYRNAYAPAPACSPSRFAILTGRYATSEGTQRLRSRFPITESIKGFPTYLREAGYYCTNNVKTDYNTSAAPRLTRQSWDECSDTAHWRNRKPGQPFFAVFNLTETHQSKIFEHAPEPRLEAAERHDPAKAPVPPFYPDTPGARRTIARVHDRITEMDRRAGEILDELQGDELRDDTIVFFWSDHGQGIPRGKRTLWDTGLRVPLVVFVPEKFRRLAPDVLPGHTSDRMVSLIDLGPTILSLLDLPVPADAQGRPFLGPHATSQPASQPAAPQYVFGARDRIDEARDLSRSVRDARYLYVRNFMPDRSWLAPEAFSDQLEFRRELAWLAAAGKLAEAQFTLAGPTKPAEALYDSEADPWQMKNLAADPQYGEVLERMRVALGDWQRSTRDLGMIPEWEAERLCGGGTPLVEATATDDVYPLARVLDTAGRVGGAGQHDELAQRLADPNPIVRYWAAIGLRATGAAVRSHPPAEAALRKAAEDASLPVRIEAAGVLAAQYGDAAALERLAAILSAGDALAAEHAARTLELLGPVARPVLPAMQQALPEATPLTRSSLAAAVQVLTGGEGASPPARDRRSRRPRNRQ
jgi:arylsulfatase A-like enzyme